MAVPVTDQAKRWGEQWGRIRENIESLLGKEFVESMLQDFGEAYNDTQYRQMVLYDADVRPYAQHSELYRLARRNAPALKLSTFVPAQPFMVLSGAAHDADRFGVEKETGHRVKMTYDMEGVEYMRYHLGQGADAAGEGGTPIHLPPIIPKTAKALGPILISDVLTGRTTKRGKKIKGRAPTEFVFWKRTKGGILPVRRWWGVRAVAFRAGFDRMVRRVQNAVTRINANMKAQT